MSDEKADAVLNETIERIALAGGSSLQEARRHVENVLLGFSAFAVSQLTDLLSEATRESKSDSHPHPKRGKRRRNRHHERRTS